MKWLVDDVVIGRTDGTIICCQCKKNQTGFRAWSFTDLNDELEKATKTLIQDPTTTVRFYSRTPFGELAALQEFSTNFPDESAYHAALKETKVHEATNRKLSELIAKISSNFNSYELLSRTKFVTSDIHERMRETLEERLQYLVSNSVAAFNSLWTCLDYQGMRVADTQDNKLSSCSRLTKTDLINLLSQSGCVISPPTDIQSIFNSFRKTSSIGRSWQRDIGGHRIDTLLVSELIEAIENKSHSILVTGGPGSGKTCILLELQEKLEQLAQSDSAMLPLFIQSREFADLETVQERQSLGLDEQWIEKIARVADSYHVIVIIDSLDVLAIAREHTVLTYFLAQIDQLLLIPNVTVITACREFDRHYDRRISQRSWDKEFKCQALDWEGEIMPLLEKLSIDSSAIDNITRHLISNPRELALFINLAQRDGSFNIVTSQALAQRYIDSIMLTNPSLGDEGKIALENMATEMLKLRSLSIPTQRFTASDDIRRMLLSHNVLHETEDNKLTFGHQTLLDVLVISRAIRHGLTLNDFIKDLPPVPFVRPSIRSFIAQLVNEGRQEFRKQLRTVLTGTYAFHIRRLVAECFAEQLPQDDDWPMLRDLRNTHRDVFQVIYSKASQVEWHYFWLRNLVPVLKTTRDVDGIGIHTYRIAHWLNLDPSDVVDFWMGILRSDWIDKSQLISKIAVSISNIKEEHAYLMSPLLLELFKFPQEEYSFLGRALARCVAVGGIDDAVLWDYIIADVKDEDILSYRFENKLKCRPHEFGDKDNKFLSNRMINSICLLDLAVESLEQWSKIKYAKYKNKKFEYCSGFLRSSSFDDHRTISDEDSLSEKINREQGVQLIKHRDSFRILLDALEIAIIHHANISSEWWQNNRERLCFNPEGSLRYFGLLACINSPMTNLDMAVHLLSEEGSLNSELSYELGTLLQKVFILLNSESQDVIQARILALSQRYADVPEYRQYMLKDQVKFIICIPCHLRSPSCVSILDEYSCSNWPLEHKPDVNGWCGIVRAPFSFEVFNELSNEGVLSLLEHYNGYRRDSFSDMLIGGEEQVAQQLSEASSRDPLRFLSFLSSYWQDINEEFRNHIMDGIAHYLNYRYGNLRPNNDWKPINEPNIDVLVSNILDELERHSVYWRQNRSASQVLQGCSHVVKDNNNAERITFLSIPYLAVEERDPISGDSVTFIGVGINMIRGHIADALMVMTIKLYEEHISWPELLLPTLHQFATNDHPAVRAVVLRRLPHLQHILPEVGWGIFELIMRKGSEGLWDMAERCLYYTYHHEFDRVSPWLNKIVSESIKDGLQAWGRISALAVLSEKIENCDFIKQLKELSDSDAWEGAIDVWTHRENFQRHQDLCLAGLSTALSDDNQYASTLIGSMGSIFREKEPVIMLPMKMLERYFSLVSTSSEASRIGLFDFGAWLNIVSYIDPLYALKATEIYLEYVRTTKAYLHDHNNNLMQLLTRLFAQAEEQEESDGGEMLHQVVALQDTMLALGVDGVNTWLEAAERA
ncbi:ATP-binding protein [Citrobacter amalonaticus]|uniref:AAA family ATPase n=1 Tax=Citrobacter amalonaticus TaxID=35703 RepID=UPI0020C028BC|nr:ATP-binding protein [Citrobacter amalonaticus]MCK8152667.1 ATP-binding protein [Citrobacter amalonaticus]